MSFDKRELFEKECRVHLENLRSLCTMFQIPFYFSACVADSGKESEYIREAVLTSTTGVKLSNDQLKKHLLVGLEFDVIPKKSNLEIMMIDPDSI